MQSKISSNSFLLLKQNNSKKSLSQANCPVCTNDNLIYVYKKVQLMALYCVLRIIFSKTFLNYL